MYARLFAESGLSLDRLKALVEVGAHGSIVKAAGTDPVRQSQYSRQIKELEGFFKTGLVERYGKGIRLTASGRELARISRFFLLGLSNFQRGCLAESQIYRICAPPAFTASFLLRALSGLRRVRCNVRWRIESAEQDEMERRLHDLTLDFAVVSRATLSRPLQAAELGSWQLRLWVPKALCRSEKLAMKAYSAGRLPLAFAALEIPLEEFNLPKSYEPILRCESYLEAQIALGKGEFAACLPDFLSPSGDAVENFLALPLPEMANSKLHYRLAWNPRLTRLNPHAHKFREALVRALAPTFTSDDPHGARYRSAT